MENIIETTEGISKFIWAWMKGLGKIPQARIEEVGMTSYMLYRLSESRDTCVLKFVDTKQPESKTGADFCFMFINKNGVQKTCLIQAKRQYPNPKKLTFEDNFYRQMKYSNKNIPQFHILEKYCKKNGVEGYYLFYNSELSCSQKINTPEAILNRVDRNYSETNNVRDVLGTFFVPQTSMVNLYTQKKGPISCEDILNCKEVLTLQEFFRQYLGPNSVSGGGPSSPKGDSNSPRDLPQSFDFDEELLDENVKNIKNKINVEIANETKVGEYKFENFTENINGLLQEDGYVSSIPIVLVKAEEIKIPINPSTDGVPDMQRNVVGGKSNNTVQIISKSQKKDEKMKIYSVEERI